MTNSALYLGHVVIRAQHTFEVVKTGKLARVQQWARSNGFNLMDFRAEPWKAFPAAGTDEKIPEYSTE